jgi:hypothetical protein
MTNKKLLICLGLILLFTQCNNAEKGKFTPKTG